MQLDLEQAGNLDLYQLATHIVVPRPIAWVTTMGGSDVINLAPFSYFGLICDEPITMVLSVGRRNGIPKDTARNLSASGEAVVHLVEEALLEPMVFSSKELTATESETALTGLITSPSIRVKPPRLDRPNIALECRVDKHFEVGNDASDVFLLRAVYAHIKDDALTNGMPDARRLRILGKLGASDYAVTDNVRTVRRP
jgi:flavin reductase (DIM6/NTAB) family NADH-FMN oxidoreductase RutF